MSHFFPLVDSKEGYVCNLKKKEIELNLNLSIPLLEEYWPSKQNVFDEGN